MLLASYRQSLERRDAAKQVQQAQDERDSVIDLTTSLREALAERGNTPERPAQPAESEEEAPAGRRFDFEKEPEALNALVSDAMKDIQDDIDLQSLVNDALAEFQGIHQKMERQKEYE